MIFASREPDIFNTSPGETPVFAGVLSGFEGCNNSSDFWKLMDDGSFEWDGEKDLVDERGKLLMSGDSSSYSNSLAMFMGISGEEAEQLMADKGMVWNEGSGYEMNNGNPFGEGVNLYLPGFESRTGGCISQTLQQRLGLFDLFPMSDSGGIDSITSQDMTEGPMAEEIQKRIGLYAIAGAESDLSGEAFERLANSSYKINDELGYFVDLSIIQDDLLDNFNGQTTLSDPKDGIKSPNWNYNFNSSGFNEIVNTYGTLFAASTNLGAGMSFEYNNYFSGENRESLSFETNSVDELLYAMNDMAKVHNQNFRGAGSFTPGYTFNNNIEFKNNSTLTTGVDALAMVALYCEGTQQGYEVTDTQLPIWNIEDHSGNTINKYFTAIQAEFAQFSNNNGSVTSQYQPHFYNEIEMRMDQGIQNYASYLEMPEGHKKNATKFWNNILWGWD